jgi:glycosyltransferase involved in cell wall biosynthesis
MKKLRVHILYEHSVDLRPHGCSYIRLLLPLRHHTVSDNLIVSYGTANEKADVTIVERTWFPRVSTAKAKDLVKQVRRDNGQLIYSIDDNLLDLASQGFNRSPFSPEQLMAMRCFMREADGIIVTTKPLQDRLAPLNDNIFVVPNALDERLWGSESPLEKTAGNPRKVIGYMGTHTHDADLMMVLQPLRETLRKHAERVELQLVGGFADRAVMEAFAGLPVRVLDVEGNVEYPAFARWMLQNVKWDLAIAPLEDDTFTRCKSDIKFLDYSILGIPGIYSRGPVYGKTIEHLETGYLAENNPQSWAEGLDLLLNDDSLRKSMARKAWEYVFSTRTLQQRASDWLEAIRCIVDQRDATRENQSSPVLTRKSHG